MKVHPFIVVVWHLLTGIAWAMYSKRKLPGDDADPSRRLRNNLADLFLSNDVSGSRAHSLFDDANVSGAKHMKDLVKAGNRGALAGNLSRDITRKLLKQRHWPKLYWCKIRVYNPKVQRVQWAKVCMLLPHEVIAVLARKGDLDILLSQEGMATSTKAHLQACCQQLAMDKLLGVSLWCDSVPCNFDRSQSVECTSIGFPGMPGTHKNLRIPVVGFNRKYLCQESYDDIFTVVAWSMRALACGFYPSARHDGEVWRASDSYRASLQGKALGIAGVLAEVRGDWAMLKSVFRFPGWSEKAGVCFKCRCKPDQVRLCGSDSPWRQERLTHWDLMAMMIQEGRRISPLFSSPCLTSECFKLDWLHVMDQGTTSDFLGSFLYYMLQFFEGSNKKLRCCNMFLNIKEFYRTHGTESKFQDLKLTMFTGKKGFKLRAKGAEARGLVPWAKTVAELHLSLVDPVQSTIRGMACSLNSCYENLAGQRFNPADMALHSRTFCLLSVALEGLSENKLWKTKPKLHQMQELLEMGVDNPTLYWCYRDEDFGGTLAGLARSRGGQSSPSSIAKRLLDKFVAKHKVPVIRSL